MANDKWIEEIADKLRDHTSEVNPQMWQGISSQIGAGTGAAASGGLGFAKIAGIVSIAVTSVAVTYFAVTSSEKQEKKEQIANTTVNAEEQIEPKEETNIVESSEKEIIQVPKQKQVIKSNIEAPKQTVVIETNNVEEKTIEAPLVPENFLKTKKAVGIVPEKINSVQKEVVQKTAEPEKVELEKALPETTETKVESEKVVTATFENLPNIFTPNNDGVNDEFFVQSTGMVNYQLVVLDVNNKVVWSTSDPNAKWDGRNLGGEKLPTGSYIYFITAEDESGNPVQVHKRLEIK
jgi:gliding motility-associated-like protein